MQLWIYPKQLLPTFAYRWLSLLILSKGRFIQRPLFTWADAQF